MNASIKYYYSLISQNLTFSKTLFKENPTRQLRWITWWYIWTIFQFALFLACEEHLMRLISTSLCEHVLTGITKILYTSYYLFVRTRG